MARSARLPLLVATLLAVTGCLNQDPIDRPGTWQATGINDRNLRAAVANPNDLYHGADAPTARGQAGSAAVTRLLTERRRPLLVQRASEVGGSQQPATDPPLPGLGDTPGSATNGAR